MARRGTWVETSSSSGGGLGALVVGVVFCAAAWAMSTAQQASADRAAAAAAEAEALARAAEANARAAALTPPGPAWHAYIPAVLAAVAVVAFVTLVVAIVQIVVRQQRAPARVPALPPKRVVASLDGKVVELHARPVAALDARAWHPSAGPPGELERARARRQARP